MSTVDRISGLEQRLSGATIGLPNHPERSHPRNQSTVVALQKSRIVFKDYLDAAGIPNIRERYTQWNGSEGPFTRQNTATPRTTNPRNTTIHGASGHQPQENFQQQASYQAPDPAYQNPLFPSPTRSSSTTVPASQFPQSPGLTYNTQQSSPYPGHDNSRNDGNDLGGRYAAQNTAAPHFGRRGTDGHGDGDPRGGRLRSNGPVGSLGPETSSRSGRYEDEGEGASVLARARTYPQSTERVRQGDNIYHDEQGRIISQEMPRRESEPAQRSASLQAVTEGVSQLQVGGRTGQGYPADRNPFSRSVAQSNPASAGPLDMKSHTARKPDLATVDEGKKLNTTVIRGGTDYNDEDLDERYILRTGKAMHKFFQSGRVFATLWHEAAGGTGTELSHGIYKPYTRGLYKQPIYSTTRYMVVIRSFPGHSWCLHIHTYGGQGVTKKGLSPAHIEMHTIIYMKNTSPKLRADEIGMTKEPIEVKPFSPTQKLDPMSRLNFGKVYTVEHNIRAMEVGMVTDQSKHLLDGYFSNVFNDSRNSENATKRRN